MVKIIVPMAGMGKRMRPHTLTIPKPLIPIAGKPIVQHLIEEIRQVIPSGIDEISFIIGDFGKVIEEQLVQIAAQAGAKGRIYYQHEALGTAHALYCAKESLNGKVIIAFADTLFKADFRIDDESEGIIWVQKVKNPSDFGVVKVGKNNIITDFIEKPVKDAGTDLAIIGIYYFQNGNRLKEEIQYLIDHQEMVKGEYQLTNALENLKNKGFCFKPAQVKEWLDCGNKNATVYTNQRILEYMDHTKLISPKAVIQHSVIIPPCFIGDNATIEHSVIGPYVSVGLNTVIKNSIINNSIIQTNSSMEGLIIKNSMIGNHVDIRQEITEVSIGDYASLIK